MNRLNITVDELNVEYAKFRPVKDSKGYDAVRFGQHVWNKHGAPGHSFPELFYERDARKAYEIAFKELNGDLFGIDGNSI